MLVSDEPSELSENLSETVKGGLGLGVLFGCLMMVYGLFRLVTGAEGIAPVLLGLFLLLGPSLMLNFEWSVNETATATVVGVVLLGAMWAGGGPIPESKTSSGATDASNPAATSETNMESEREGSTPTPTLESNREAEREINTPSPRPEKNMLPKKAASYVETELEAEGYRHVDVQVSNGNLDARYATGAQAADELYRETADVVSEYAAVVSRGFDGDMHMTIVDIGMDRVGEYRVNNEWAVEYNEGELTLSEFVERIWQTYQE